MTQPFSTITQDEYDALKVTIAVRDAEIKRLRNDLREWAECCQIDVVMQGPVRMGWNRSALDRCLDKYEAALQPKEGEG